MEEAVRVLQQQVNALMSQNAALEAQLTSQQKIAQGLAELPGAITTVLTRAQAPTRRMLVDPKGLGKPPMFPGKEEHFYVWTKKIENNVSGVFRTCVELWRLQQSRKTWSQQQQLRSVCLSSELRRLQRLDLQLFVVLSALTVVASRFGGRLRWNMFVPPDHTPLVHKFLRMYTSHSNLKEYFNSGIVNTPNTVSSFVIRSIISRTIDVPLDWRTTPCGCARHTSWYSGKR